MGLGSAASVPLADAREKAASARRKIARGLNPIEERKRDGGIPTFGDMADDVRQALSAGFRNEKHKAQWKSTLETYAAPLNRRGIRSARGGEWDRSSVRNLLERINSRA